MKDDEIETYFLWLTEEEQSDLFSYEDRSRVSSLICEVPAACESISFQLYTKDFQTYHVWSSHANVSEIMF